MKIVLYRRRLSLTSGAGQLIRMQQDALRAAGHDAVAACRRGAFQFMLRTRLPARRMTAQALGSLTKSGRCLVVDHQMAVPEADLVFVHNLMSEARVFLEREDWAPAAILEASFFRALRPGVPIVANSELVRRALLRRFDLQPERVVVRYPGFRSDIFGYRGAASNEGGAPRPARADDSLRARVRASLGVVPNAPLVGFVTSGEFDKRGLDIFLDAAARISAAKEEARFLVVGARRLPPDARRHAVVRNGRLLYRTKGGTPERWFRALDLFLYPARFEEFGMVVSEAQASGLPVLTSRRVGAAECLPEEYEPWLLDEPDAAPFAANALALLDDPTAREQLSAAGLASVGRFDRENYARATIGLILDCAREKAAR